MALNTSIQWRETLWGVAGFLSFLLLNLLLEGRVHRVVRLCLGVWVMQLCFYWVFAGYQARPFARHALVYAAFAAAAAALIFAINQFWQIL